MTQLSLFPEPEDVPPPTPACRPPKGTWSRYHGKHRQLCWACVQAIHELGVQGAPPPRASTYALRTDKGTEFFCTPHYQQLLQSRPSTR